MKPVRIAIITLGIIAAVIAGGLITSRLFHQTEVTDFASCKAAGYPIQESFPEVCRTPDGKTFIAPAPTD